MGKKTLNWVEKRLRLEKVLFCSYCPPNGGENAKRKSRHGTKKPKYKNKRNIKITTQLNNL